MTIYKVTQFNNISPNHLTKKFIAFLILFAVGALLRLIIKYQGLLITQNITIDHASVINNAFEFAFLCSSTIFFFYYLSIIYSVSYGCLSKKAHVILIVILITLTLSEIFLGDAAYKIMHISGIGNLITRIIIYISLGFTLIRALRSTSDNKKMMLYFAGLYFSLETISLLMNDIFHLWNYYDSLEYLINNIIPFVFAVPFLQNLYPKPDTDIEKMKELFDHYGFNERELSIIKLICDGKLNKEIASELGIAENTVKFYIYNIYKKINVKNRVELVKHVSAYPPNKKPSLPR